MLAELKTKVSFPNEIFGDQISQSFQDLAKEYSLPTDYVSVSALWAVASLIGNCYKTELNGEMKAILYCIMVGPSSIGKSKAYDIVFGDIIEHKSEHLFKVYEHKFKEWSETKEVFKSRDQPFSEPMPQRKIRSASGATLEAITKYASTNPQGFGVYFDEGKKLYQGGSYSKENNSVDFWNNAWNGKVIDDLRKDHKLETRVSNPAISILAGMQSKRINEMFDKNTIESGLLNRFLFTCSDYIELNENRDSFGVKGKAAQLWIDKIEFLFDLGVYHTDESAPMICFTNEAKIKYNEIKNFVTKESNQLIKSRKEGDVSELLIGYMGKMYAYFGRLTLISCIIRKHEKAEIDIIDVENAYKIYLYFKDQAINLLTEINQTEAMNMDAKLLLLYNLLPDTFTSSDAIAICKQLKYTDSYFHVNFSRKLNGKYIRKKDRSTYEKI